MGYGYPLARAMCNKVLLSMGCSPILNDADFSNLNATDNYQRQIIIFMEMIQRRLILNCNSSRFAQRKFTFQTNAIDTEYQPNINHIYAIEGFKANSFFNVTVNGSVNQRLAVKTYNQWREAYPRPDQVARGFPRYIIPVPEDGTDEVKVIVFPYPAAVYTIEGQGRIEAPDLTDGAQPMLVPKKYEHLLLAQGKIYLEQSVNEGRQFDWEESVAQMYQEVMRDALGAQEETEQVDYGFRLWNDRNQNSTRDYNPATDILPPFP